MTSYLTDESQLNSVLESLETNSPVQVDLEDGGMLRVDRPVPFLLVYRFPIDEKDYFTLQLGMTESSFLLASSDDEFALRKLLTSLVKYLSDRFGSFMLLEAWVTTRKKANDFTILINRESTEPMAHVLEDNLNFKVGRSLITSTTETVETICPPGQTPLFSKQEAKTLGCLVMGLEIKPIYINEDTGKAYPLFLRELRNSFSTALKKAFFEFVRMHTSYNASHFQMLGTTVVEDLVWEIDASLAAYSNQFDFLFLVTPVNVDEAWNDFVKSGFQKAPAFHYRHMPIDPEIIKRKIYALPIEKVIDPTIAFLFRDKRKEIDRMLDMMVDREKPDFLQSSIQLFGQIEEDLLDVAKGLLAAIQVTKKDNVDRMSADEFISLAEDEMHFLRDQYSEVNPSVNVRDDIEGIFVSRGNLYLNKNFSVDRRRAFALIQHEIGTHIATYYNGKAQPLKLFSTGVPGYEQLQEGLAVFAEYLTGGLTNSRLRILAARVIAVNHLISGHGFIDTFFLLQDKYDFAPESAFSITMRVYRGGGLTKDAVYLKGLLHLLEYLKDGKDLMPLLIGKIRQDYLPVIEELTYRKMLKPIPIKPRFLSPEYEKPLRRAKEGLTVFNLIE